MESQGRRPFCPNIFQSFSEEDWPIVYGAMLTLMIGIPLRVAEWAGLDLLRVFWMVVLGLR